MRTALILLVVSAIVVMLFFRYQRSGVISDASGQSPPALAPEFTQTAAERWLNSAPLRIADLRGKVIMLDFWAFECWNCYRSFPWLNDLEARFQDKGLQIIGIHTPEFEREKNPETLARKIKEFKLHHPVMMDNDFAYWNAMRNRYWPAFYLIDKKGNVRATFIGETHVNSAQAKRIEAAIEALLAE